MGLTAADRSPVRVWEVDLPLPRPVATVIGALTTMYLVVVAIEDAVTGTVGMGYASLHAPDLRPGVIDAIGRLVAAGHELSDLRAVEALDDAGVAGGPDVVTRAAASVVSLAAWDLEGRRTGQSCAALWSRTPRATLPCYASGLFAGGTAEALVDEATRYRDEGFAAVKMRVGQDPAEDLARLRLVQSVFPEPACVAVDAFESWTVDQANRFLAGVETPLAWVEDPTPERDLHQVTRRAGPMASGERSATIDEIDDLVARNGTDLVVLPDVQAVGGPTRFLSLARGLVDRGIEVGSHVFGYPSVPLLAALDRSSGVELLDWWDALYETRPRPDGTGRLATAGVGLGAAISMTAIERWGRRTYDR